MAYFSDRMDAGFAPLFARLP
jgi:hypothetical protein